MSDNVNAVEPQIQEGKPTIDQLPEALQRKVKEFMAETKSAKQKQKELAELAAQREVELERLKEAKQLELDQKEAEMKQILETLDSYDPGDAVNKVQQLREEIKKNQKLQEDQKKRDAAIEAKYRQSFETQKSELVRQLEEQSRYIASIKQDRALEAIYRENDGTDFATFKALLDVNFSIVYDEDGSVLGINKKDGTPIDLNGKSATLDDVFLAMRKGEYGETLRTVFRTYNSSRGANIPGGISSGAKPVIQLTRSSRSGIPIINRETAQALKEGRTIK